MARLPGSKAQEFQVVPLDGLLVDVRTPLKPIVAHLLSVVPEEWPLLEPPHTVARLGRSIGLSPVKVRALEYCIREIPNWYRSLPLTEVARDYRSAIIEGMKAGQIILLARRLRTRGDPLFEQTMSWLRAHGFNDRVQPIIWIKED